MMRNLERKLRLLAVALTAAATAACGGGSGSSEQQKIAGATSWGAGARICVDRNLNLQCDAGDPAALADADGRYEILVDGGLDVSSLLLVAEPAGGKAAEGQPHRLATWAGWSNDLNVLSTLVASQVLSRSAADANAAYGDIVSTFGLAEGVSLSATWASIEPVAQVALREAMDAAREQSGAEGYSASVVTKASQALVESLSRYVDGSTGQLLPVATAHFLKTDVRGTLGLELCLVPEVHRLNIVTEGGAPVLDKENYVKALVGLQGADGVTLAENLGARIRGRGNSTWGMPKKPFRLKLDASAGLLGMTSGKDWTLLANYADKTLLRNEVAFCLARTLGMPYTPQSRMVEIMFNGEYLGQYQLSNRTDELEVDLKAQAMKEGVNTAAPLSEFNDVFLIEIDERLDSEFWFRTETSIPYAMQTDSDSEQTARVARWFNHLEDVLRDRSVEDRIDRVSQYVDLESLVDFSLVNELLKNNDVFFSSTSMYRSSPNGRLIFGPVWDFDIAAGNNNTTNFVQHPHGWYLPERFNGWYFNTLMEEQKFRSLREARWKYLSSQMRRVDRFVEQAAAAMGASQARNFQRWPILDQWVWPNAVVLGSHEAEVRYLRDWMTERASWMDQNIGE